MCPLCRICFIMRRVYCCSSFLMEPYKNAPNNCMRIKRLNGIAMHVAEEKELENNLIERSTTDSDGSSIECRRCVVVVVVSVAFVYERIRLPNRMKTKRKEEPTKKQNSNSGLHMHNWLKLVKEACAICVYMWHHTIRIRIAIITTTNITNKSEHCVEHGTYTNKRRRAAIWKTYDDEHKFVSVWKCVDRTLFRALVHFIRVLECAFLCIRCRINIERSCEWGRERESKRRASIHWNRFYLFTCIVDRSIRFGYFIETFPLSTIFEFSFCGMFASNK